MFLNTLSGTVRGNIFPRQNKIKNFITTINSMITTSPETQIENHIKVNERSQYQIMMFTLLNHQRHSPVQ